MLYDIYRATLVLLLCGVICEISCNTLSEKRLADVDVQLSDMKEQFDGRFEKIEKDIQSLNEAMTKLVFTLLEEKRNSQEEGHEVKKRDVVVSSNPLTNLPLSDLAGLRGEPGKDGKDGLQGAAGRDGLPGPVGSAGPPGTSGNDGTSVGAGGAVYTRWGRTTCGKNSQLLYSGYAGGSNYDQTGGGVNYQCMPLDPQYNQVYDGTGTWWGSYMAGVEYHSYSYGVFPSSAYEQNVPCARCYTNNRSALMMIPAKRDCSEGWSKEYEGYLMTQYYNDNHQTTFECVDASPEYVYGEGANNQGALFYFIRTQCNKGGHCPPYDDSKEMTCVVCSK